MIGCRTALLSSSPLAVGDAVSTECHKALTACPDHCRVSCYVYTAHTLLLDVIILCYLLQGRCSREGVAWRGNCEPPRVSFLVCRIFHLPGRMHLSAQGNPELHNAKR